MRNENKLVANNLTYSLLFFVFGIILLTSTEDLISIASKVIGAILIIVGIIKSIVYIYMKGKLGDYKLSELILGILIISCGTLLIFYSNALSFAIRTIAGIWILFAGINKIILAISIKKIDKTGFKVYIVTSIIMLILGVGLITGLFDKLIGLFIIGYSITEIVNYIYFISKNKNNMYKEQQVKKTKSKLKKIKNNKVVDATIEE